MSRRHVLVLVAALTAGLAAATDLPDIQKRGSLKVLVFANEDREMFSFDSSGKPGFEREILEGFTRLQRVRLEVVRVAEWDQIIPRLNRGEGDVITGILDTEARRKLVEFTVEVLPSRHVVVTRKPRRVVSTVEELREETVGTVKGTSWAELLEKVGVPASRMEYFLDGGDVLVALRSGRVTASVMSSSGAVVAASRDPDLQLGLLLGEPASAAFAVRKQDAQLKRALDDYVGSVRRSGTWSRLVVEYFGENALEALGRAGRKGTDGRSR